MGENRVELMRYLSNKCFKNMINLKIRDYNIPLIRDEWGNVSGGDKFMFELGKDGRYLSRVIHLPTFESDYVDPYISKLDREIDMILLH